MVMSEQGGGGLAMHQLPMHHHHHHHHHHRGGGLVQPSLVMNPLGDPCSIDPKTNKPRILSHCVGCGGQIHDQYILRVAPDLEWHAACLKCQECHRFLDETCTCFVRDGKTYCKNDYVRLFGTKCDKCGSSFRKNDFVMRAKNKIYHVDCFRCCACTKQLMPGDEFALREGGALYCKEDHDVMEKSSGGGGGGGAATPLSTTPHHHHHHHHHGTESNNNNSLSNNNNNNSNNSSTELGCMSDSGSESGSHKGSGGAGGGGGGGGSQRKSSGSGGGSGGGGGGDGKPTRVRTVLNEKQLHTLRTCYAANPRPDALMKEQLVEMTGLSPRVIRVWFQNKRCKDKKKTILMKQQMQQEKFYAQDGRKLGYGAMQGIPMVASSPVRHDSPLGGVHPLEVQAYQPPWKALSDFALHSDLEQPHAPAFQQLVNQMHGYDLPPPNLGGPLQGPPGTLMHATTAPIIGQQQQPPPPPPSSQTDSMTHPDSTDSYVTYLESDDSLPASP